ncbi:MAG: hypothetical protein H6721_09050 [Sandaracinus sp.]|nr:hypothetical protein [Sandaracinus sp.]MCB9632263.1 hypothetical protein [Sandaracinus sp.]
MKRFFVVWLLCASIGCGGESEPEEASSAESSGSTRADMAPVEPSACAQDGDCVLRTKAQCSCGVAHVDAPPPPTPSEACFADPCMRSVARCASGRCVVADAP